MVINLGRSEVSPAIEIQLEKDRNRNRELIQGEQCLKTLTFSHFLSGNFLHIYSTALCFYDPKRLLEENFDWSLPDPFNFMEMLATLAW